MTRKVTKTEFNAFKKRARECIAALGLTEWRVSFKHEKLGEDDFALCRTNAAGYVCSLVLTTEIDREVDHEFDPVKHAEHEVLHIAVRPLAYVAECRFVRPDDVNNNEEALVRRLQAALNGKGWVT